MQLTAQITLSGAAYAVPELTVRNVWRLWGSVNEAWSSALVESISPKPDGLVGEDVSRLWAEIRRVNASLFGEGEGESGGPAVSREELTASICRVIRAGHVNAWDYGWSVFLIAAEEAAGADRDAVQNQALAVRMGQHADRQTWSKFMRPSRPSYGPKKYGNAELANRFRKRKK